jgi:hypothetical protein
MDTSRVELEQDGDIAVLRLANSGQELMDEAIENALHEYVVRLDGECSRTRGHGSLGPR